MISQNHGWMVMVIFRTRVSEILFNAGWFLEIVGLRNFQKNIFPGKLCTKLPIKNSENLNRIFESWVGTRLQIWSREISMKFLLFGISRQ